MDGLSLIVGFLLGAVAVGVVVAWAMRASQFAQAAALSTERDLLRERVTDLESALGSEHETASVLAPLQQTLSQVQRQVATLERDRVEQYGQLGAQLRHVASTTQSLQSHTAALSGALRSSSASGIWGEAQLRRVLEHSGMLAHCDFDEQVRAKVGDTDVRPDALIRLPSGRVIVIDAKAPVAAYLEAHDESLDSDAREALLRRHAAALTRHVDTLSSKSYWKAFEQTPEMVLCFVPADAMLAGALRTDPGLFERAADRHVVLVSPSTLLASLRAISLVWQQDSVARNAQELLTLGQTLYERIGTLARHTTEMGTSLRRTVERYNLLVGSLESRVLVTARSMHELGVSPSPPPHLEPVEAAPRPLTAAELLGALDEDVARPQLEFDVAADRNQSAG